MDGVKLPGGGELRIATLLEKSNVKIPAEFKDLTKNDNAIIVTALQVRKTSPVETILVSKDINVRIKCDAIGLASEDYLRMRVSETRDSFYTGITCIEADKDLIDEIYHEGFISIDKLNLHRNLYPNEYVMLKAYDGSSVLLKYVASSKIVKQIDKNGEAFGLRPRNLEQWFALDMLFDPNIKLVTITGPAGCGKTLLAVAAGMHLTFQESRYEKLIITRPVQPLG